MEALRYTPGELACSTRLLQQRPQSNFFFFFHMDHLHEKIDPAIVANTPTITVFTSGASRGHDCPMLGA